MARPTTDLAEWLGRHGLGQYVQTFAENNIEYSVLPDLTENDLEKLGVSLGHRKKLLRAIEALTAAGQRTDTTTAVSKPKRLDEARALLEPICHWFDEGAETADLRRARDALSALY